MGYLFFVYGLVTGVLITLLYKSRERINGIIHVDHNTEQCMISLTSMDLSDRNKKIAVFVINHNANISREEQGL